MPEAIVIGGDLSVSRLGYGAMRLAGPGIWGDPADRDAARRVLRRAVELGVNFIDTADAYGPETNERLVADALHPYPPGLVIATKGGIVRPSRDRWDSDGRPEHLRAACEASLSGCASSASIFTSCTPSTLRSRSRIRSARSRGSSGRQDPPRRRVELRCRRARAGAQGRGGRLGSEPLQRVRPLVRPVLAVCERDGLAFIPWSPLTQSPRDSGRRSARQARGLGVRPRRLVRAGGDRVVARAVTRDAADPRYVHLPHLEENAAAGVLRLTREEFVAIG